MQSHVIKSTGELNSLRWDSLEQPSFYLSSDWLRARSQTIKGAERFILVSDTDDKPLAAAPGYLVDSSSHPGFVPARVLTISDLADSELELGPTKALAELRDELSKRGGEWAPSLVMSAPGRYGGISYKRNLTSEDNHAALVSLVDAVERQATADAARAICWLYFSEKDNSELAGLLHQRGYLSLVVDAECYLPIHWQDFQGYLSTFGRKDRWQIKHEMAALDRAGVKVELHGVDALGPELAPLERQWREKYGRMPPIAEILADYENLRSLVSRSVRVFVARLGERPIGFSVFLDQEDRWYARFCGFDYSVKDLFLYFNLLFYWPMEVFIERGVRCVYYALKAYEAKCSRGCRLANVMLYVRPPQGWSRLSELLPIIDSAQRSRFQIIENRYHPAR